MFLRYGTLTNIELLDEKQCNESGMLKTANLATDWKEIVKKSYTQPNFEIQGELDLPNFIYFKARAISSMEKWGNNGNGDAFPADEIKKAVNTFVGKGLYIEHNSDDPEKSVGIIVSAKYLEDKGYAECICAISKSDHPEVCKQIVAGDYGAVSMGCICTEAECSVCHNVAHNESELCSHMKPYQDMNKNMPNPQYCKGRSSAMFPILASENKVAYEINRKLVFNELSLVKKPADKDASIYQQTIIASKQEEKMPADNILDKLSYNDYKNLKKALADEDDSEFITKIATKIKAELSETMKSKSEERPEAAVIEPEKKPALPKEQLKQVKEEVKELKEEIKEIKEEVKEVIEEVKEDKKEDVKEDKKEDVKEVKEDKKEDVKEDKKEDKKEEVKEDKKEEVKEDKKELPPLGEEKAPAPAEGGDLPALTDEEIAEIEKSLTGGTDEVPAGNPEMALAASKNTNKEESDMDLTYIPGTTFDTSYFVAEDGEGNRKSVKASLVIPKEVQDKITKGEPTASVEDAIVKITASCKDYAGFEKLASEVGTEGFSKKAYDFFAMKMEKDYKASNEKEPEMAIDPKDANTNKEKATKSAPKNVQQYFGRLPGSTAADPEIALNLKSQLDESLKGVEDLKKVVAEKDALIAKKDADLTKLATEIKVLSKKIKSDEVNSVLENVETDGIDIVKAKDQLSGLTEEQLNVVREIVKTAKVAEPKKIEASAGNAPAIFNNEKGPESNLEMLITEWSANTDAKNYSNEL